MWDYICPKCKKEVAKNSHECPSCGERFPFPVRVPPKVLKDSKALENYVHQHIFPKVSPLHRAYLTQFFTTLFSDGFETGNFNNWTGTDYLGDAPTVVTTQKHHGTYSAYFVVSVAGRWCVVYKTLTEQTTFYMRFYFYLNSEGLDDNDLMATSYIGIGTTTTIVRAKIRQVSGALRWAFEYKNGSGTTTETHASAAPTLGSWHCVEIGAYIHSSAGWAKMYVDGNLLFDKTGLNTGTSGATRFEVGVADDVATAYVDCVVVADTYIGVEEEVVGQPYISRVQFVQGMRTFG